MFKAVAFNHKKTIEVKDKDVVLDSFVIEFKRFTDKQRADLLAEIISEAKSLDASLENINDVSVIKESIGKSINVSVGRIKLSIAGWDGVTDAEGEQVAFTSENLDKLLEWREYRTPIEVAFIKTLTESALEEAAKN